MSATKYCPCITHENLKFWRCIPCLSPLGNQYANVISSWGDNIVHVFSSSTFCCSGTHYFLFYYFSSFFFFWTFLSLSVCPLCMVCIFFFLKTTFVKSFKDLCGQKVVSFLEDSVFVSGTAILKQSLNFINSFWCECERL